MGVQLQAFTALTPEKITLFVEGIQKLSGRCGKEKNIFPVQGFETRIIQ
jgi:hypothetical protein